MVSEVIDLDAVIAASRQQNKQLSADQERLLEEHLRAQHLTPDQAGAIAAQAGAGELVFTHLAIPTATAVAEPVLLKGAHATYAGKVMVAHDLERF